MGLAGQRFETFAAALCTVERALGHFIVNLGNGDACLETGNAFQGQGLNPLLWQVDSLPLSHQGSPYSCFLISCLNPLWIVVSFSLEHTEPTNAGGE